MIPNLYTTEDLEKLKKELYLLEQSLFQTKSDAFQTTLKTEVRASVAFWIEKELTSKKDAHTLISELQSQLKNIDVIELTLAFEPTLSAIERIYTYVKTILSDDFVLDIVFDRSVLGGALIVNKGQYRDYSVKKKLALYLSDLSHLRSLL